MINSWSVVICLLYIICVATQIFAWTTDSPPKLKLKYTQEERSSFYGNQTDYFRILDQDDRSLLIGARNVMYNVSLNSLIENRAQRLEWRSSVAHRELCTLKGKKESECQNYIRVYARMDANTIMICGTNSFKPMCRTYNTGGDNTTTSATLTPTDVTANDEATTIVNDNVMPVEGTKNPLYKFINEVDSPGRCPFSPLHNSSYIFTGGQLYSATVADFSAADSLIFNGHQRTEQYNMHQLNQPAFISTVERNGYVFFFFREVAMENTNCGKTVYSRVGRVCKNDHGGPLQNNLDDYFTSYLKSRLNCSVPGDFPFYFDEIQGTTEIIDGLYQAAINQRNRQNYHTTERSELKQQSIIYAVFATPQNAIPGSAVCAFNINDIIATYEGDFKGQESSTSNWLAVRNVPEPRPGKCVDSSSDLPALTINFAKRLPLMDAAVPAMYGRPLLTRINHRFTAITVDPQVEAMDGQRYDIIYVGTDTGKVIKFINLIRTNDESDTTNESIKSNDRLETIIITESQVLPIGTPVREMTIAKEQQKLIVISDGNIVSVKLHHCNLITKCRDCMNLQDPHCAWDGNNHECVAVLSIKKQNRDNFAQNLRQSDQNSVETVEKCKIIGDDLDNRIDQQDRNKNDIETKTPTKNNDGDKKAPNNNGSTGSGSIDVDNLNPDNEIPPVDSLKPATNDIEDNGTLGIVVPEKENDSMAAASNRSNGQVTFMAHPMFAGVIFIVFAVGLAIGFILSRRLKLNQSPFDILRSGSGSSSSTHHHLNEHHRNQLNYYDKTTRGIPAGVPRNANNGTSGKDINLLMNVMGPYIAAGGGNNGRTSLTGQVPNNLNKKDILELDFETKDRSHECKNSTENLDINDMKTNTINNSNTTNSNNAPQAVIVNTTNTGTLQKVKKTYL